MNGQSVKTVGEKRERKRRETREERMDGETDGILLVCATERYAWLWPTQPVLVE